MSVIWEGPESRELEILDQFCEVKTTIAMKLNLLLKQRPPKKSSKQNEWVANISVRLSYTQD